MIARCGLGAALLGALSIGCGGELDAGYDEPHGLLPVDERNPLVVVNDGALDNWQVEYAALLAATRRAELLGLVVNVNVEYDSIETNVGNFRKLIAAARDSGMRFLPDPSASIAPSLVVPDSGLIEDTRPNRSEGARLIVRAAAERGSRARPLAIATGGALADVADAYLLDPTIVERVVVVASLGETEGSGARQLEPNGNRDPWATVIVTSRLRFVQVNGYYDQLLDLPEERVDDLPDNAFGAWMAQKRRRILDLLVACDQVSVLASALPWFASSVTKLRRDPDDSTHLTLDPEGPIWHVERAETDRARDEIWQMLSSPDTFR